MGGQGQGGLRTLPSLVEEVRVWIFTVGGPSWIPCLSATAEGLFVYSLNLTDIGSTWVETRAVLGKGEVGILEAFSEITEVLPFKVLDIDSDNGGEFINRHLYGYCHDRDIGFTRSRPYKKDDNAHIEQKNWTHVRKLIGWD